MNLSSIIDKAQASRFYLWLLNQGLSRMIPFNKPHGFKIINISPDQIKTKLPYKKRNLNHIKGIHACAMATISEYTTGLMILYKLDVKKYRIIMQKLEMDYHFQAKMDAFAEFSIDEKWVKNEVEKPLVKQDSVVIPCEIKLYDKNQNHLCTGQIYWQIKTWEKVKTKL
jgi:acyl-coenzyme A thioesterase PaaI-like protein